MDMASLPKYPEQPADVPEVGERDVPDVSGAEAGSPVFWFLVGRLRANAGSWGRLCVLMISAGCYLLSLGLPAAEGLLRSYSGVECLLSPIIETPFVLLVFPSWWANPVYASGLLAFGLRRYGFAFMAGLMSLLLAALYALLMYGSSHNQNPYPRLWFWCAAMATLTVGGFAGLIVSCSADFESEVTGVARTTAEPVTAPPSARG